jgi:hypothetical protein
VQPRPALRSSRLSLLSEEAPRPHSQRGDENLEPRRVRAPGSKVSGEPVLVAHACNPNYLEG